MIISRTPLRVSFCGGGTDLPSFYRQHGGAVLSMSIRKYIYLSMHASFEPTGYLLKYSQTENVERVDEIQHRIIRQVFKDFRIDGVDFSSAADIPGGTGLGSSSAFTVGLLNLCNNYIEGKYMDRSELAAMACEVELNKLGEPIGRQDQYGAALGGMNFIRFHEDDTVTHEPVVLNEHQKRRLNENLTMFYLGSTRSASAVLEAQNTAIVDSVQVVENLKAMAAQAEQLRFDITDNLDCLGDYLHEGWERKRSLTKGISSPLIDSVYTRARGAGATGGKLLGAGGAGFLLVYTPWGERQKVQSELKEFRSYPVTLDTTGATIVYAD